MLNNGKALLSPDLRVVISWGDRFNGGGFSDVKRQDELDQCNASKIFSTVFSYAALCSDRTVFAWGRSDSTARFVVVWHAWASRVGKAGKLGQW